VRFNCLVAGSITCPITLIRVVGVVDPLQQLCSGFQPGLEPKQEFGTVANTIGDVLSLISVSFGSLDMRQDTSQVNLPSLPHFFSIYPYTILYRQWVSTTATIQLSSNNSSSINPDPVADLYSIITAKVRRDSLESQKKYTKKKYCKYNDFNKCSKGKHKLQRGFERRYCSIPIDVWASLKNCSLTGETVSIYTIINGWLSVTMVADQ